MLATSAKSLAGCEIDLAASNDIAVQVLYSQRTVKVMALSGK